LSSVSSVATEGSSALTGGFRPTEPEIGLLIAYFRYFCPVASEIFNLQFAIIRSRQRAKRLNQKRFQLPSGGVALLFPACGFGYCGHALSPRWSCSRIPDQERSPANLFRPRNDGRRAASLAMTPPPTSLNSTRTISRSTPSMPCNCASCSLNWRARMQIEGPRVQDAANPNLLQKK